MTNECLKERRMINSSIKVPHLDNLISSTCDNVLGVTDDIHSCHLSIMTVENLFEQLARVRTKAEEFD